MSTPVAPQFTQRNYTWTAWKAVRALKIFAYQHEDDGVTHTIWGYDGPEVHICTIWKGIVPQHVIDSGYSQSQNDSDKSDFTTNFLAGANRPIETRDSDSSNITKLKTTKIGWHFEPRAICFTTAKRGALHNRKSNGNSSGAGTDIGDVTVKFYDSSGNELVQGGQESDADFQTRLTSNCTKTTMDWQAAYDHDIIGGVVMVKNVPQNDTHAWVIAAPDIPTEYGGNVHFLQGGLNLAFFNEKTAIAFDGRSIKTVLADPVYNTNKFRVLVLHPVGQQVDLQIVWHHFKA